VCARSRKFACLKLQLDKIYDKGREGKKKQKRVLPALIMSQLEFGDLRYFNCKMHHI
jgi:hypothetical protein